MLALQESAPRIYTQKKFNCVTNVCIMLSIIIRYTKIMATTSPKLRPPSLLCSLLSAFLILIKSFISLKSEKKI